MAISDLIKTYTETRRAMREQLQSAFKQEVKAFFEANPECLGVRWAQYTPYFNDGDECNFGVNEPEFNMSGSDDFEEVWVKSSEALIKAERSWRDGPYNLWGFDEDDECDIMKDMFGDHIQVVATREGFAVSKYAHD